MRGILFDKDGTLLDFERSWSGVYRELCLDLCDGDEQRARAMLQAGGVDPESGAVRAGSVLAAGNTRDIVRHWYPAVSDDAFNALVARIDAVFYENSIRCSVPVAGLEQALAALAAAGFSMGVAT